jgi:hypothetical protein
MRKMTYASQTFDKSSKSKTTKHCSKYKRSGTLKIKELKEKSPSEGRQYFDMANGLL